MHVVKILNKKVMRDAIEGFGKINTGSKYSMRLF